MNDLEDHSSHRSCFRDTEFSRFGKTSMCEEMTDRRTERQTDGQTQDHSIYDASIALRVKSTTAVPDAVRHCPKRCSVSV